MVDVKSNCIIIELEDIQKKTIRVSFWNPEKKNSTTYLPTFG